MPARGGVSVVVVACSVSYVHTTMSGCVVVLCARGGEGALASLTYCTVCLAGRHSNCQRARNACFFLLPFTVGEREGAKVAAICYEPLSTMQ